MLEAVAICRLGVAAGLIAIGMLGCENPQPPMSCGAIPQQTVTVGQTGTVSACFNDPNGDLLSYVAVSTNPGVAAASAVANLVTITAVTPGNVSVTVHRNRSRWNERATGLSGSRPQPSAAGSWHDSRSDDHRWPECHGEPFGPFHRTGWADADLLPEAEFGADGGPTDTTASPTRSSIGCSMRVRRRARP